MEEEYIDISNISKHYASATSQLLTNPKISDHNKQLVKSYLRDAALGKTIIDRAKKKISPSTLISYICHLSILILFVNKDLDKLDNSDMENYIEALETDVIRSRKKIMVGRQIRVSNTPYSPRYKVDNKVTIKKFYKWLLGDNIRYPKIVEWFDTYIKEKEISALTVLEIERLVDRGKKTLQRAFVQMLFDGGFRISEFLNIRLHHLRLRNFDEVHQNSIKCFSARVVFSKTFPRTVLMPMGTTTKWLKMWLEEHPANPRIKPDGTIEADDVTMPLFPITAGAARQLLSRLGRHVLGKRVYPHLLRHSSATYWCNKLSYFQLCKRFGWSMTSKQPKRYIDREGIEELAVARNYYDDERSKLTR